MLELSVRSAVHEACFQCFYPTRSNSIPNRNLRYIGRKGFFFLAILLGDQPNVKPLFDP